MAVFSQSYRRTDISIQTMAQHMGIKSTQTYKWCPWVLVIFRSFSPEHEAWAVYSSVYTQYVNHKSAARSSLRLFLSLSPSLSLYLCLSLHFTHLPGHRLLKRFNLKSCLAYFTSPTCFFLYPVLCCCWKDVSLTLHVSACGYTSLCLYTCLLFVRAVCS